MRKTLRVKGLIDFKKNLLIPPEDQKGNHQLLAIDKYELISSKISTISQNPSVSMLQR